MGNIGYRFQASLISGKRLTCWPIQQQIDTEEHCSTPDIHPSAVRKRKTCYAKIEL
jgi:hypothetical protein